MYLIYPDNYQGLVEDHKWGRYLDKYEDELIRQIRLKLTERLSGFNEKFNYNSRYFGYCLKDESDKLYIYVQKKNLRIDLCISRKYERELHNQDYVVKYHNNYQGMTGWLTGWQVPQSTTDADRVVKWLCKAFEENL